MRKFLCLAITCFLSLSCFSQDYNSAQESLRNQIKTYLTNKGFNPENQSDGLKIKSEGVTYYVEISSEDVSPMYIRLARYVKYSDDLTHKKLYANINQYNVKFCAKVTPLKNSILISAEMYLNQASEFYVAFDTLLEQVKSATETLKD